MCGPLGSVGVYRIPVVRAPPFNYNERLKPARRVGSRPGGYQESMYLFNHIPKCGGLSYRALFEDLFGRERVEHISVNLEEEYTLSPEQFQQFTMLMGHFGVRWNEVVGPGRRWMTALREPIDRVVSTYYYWRHNTPLSPESPWLYLAQSMSLDEFIRCGHYLVMQGISNVQTWLLADDLRWRYHIVPERDALEVAKANLDKFDFIGIHEEFEESVSRMCAYLGFARPEKAPYVNKTRQRAGVRELSPTTIESIVELNQADIELYQYALKKAHNACKPDHEPGLIANSGSGQSARNGGPAQMRPVPADRAGALKISIVSIPHECPCRGVMEAMVEVFNGGLGLWHSAPPNPLFLSYRWFTEQGELNVFEGWRSEIRPALEQFSTKRYRMHILAPAVPGRYTLRITLVQELVHWFDDLPLECAEEIKIGVGSSQPGQLREAEASAL